MRILISAFVLLVTANTVAQARDFEMGGDSNYPYATKASEPGTGHRRAAVPSRTRHIKPPRAVKM